MGNWFNAWAAGIIDGEGCIRIRKCLVEKRWLCYSLIVVVGQSGQNCPIMLTKLHEAFGGAISRSKDDRRRLPKWQWTVAALDAEKLLRAIIPYMIQKKDQAQIALQYRKEGVGKGRTHIAEKYYWQLRGMKNYVQTHARWGIKKAA